MDFYQEVFINNLKKYRSQKKYSQSKLAEKCEVSLGTIGNIECGNKYPSFELIVKIGKALNISVYKLFVIPDEIMNTFENDHIEFSPAQLAFINKELLSAVQTAVDNLIKELIFKKYI